MMSMLDSHHLDTLLHFILPSMADFIFFGLPRIYALSVDSRNDGRGRVNRKNFVIASPCECKAKQSTGFAHRIVIARICVADSWQSILATYESNANFLLWANLCLDSTHPLTPPQGRGNMDLLFHFCAIYFLCSLDTLDLDGYFASLVNPADCFVALRLRFVCLAMTNLCANHVSLRVSEANEAIYFSDL